MVYSLYLCGLLVSHVPLCIVCACHLESLPRYLRLTIPNGTKVPQSDVNPPHFPLAHSLFFPCDPLLLLGRCHSLWFMGCGRNIGGLWSMSAASCKFHLSFNFIFQNQILLL